MAALAASAVVAPGVVAARDHATPGIGLRDESALLRIRGAHRIGPAGDVNGDGTPDILVSSGDFWQRPPSRGRSWVVFGSPTLEGTIRLDDLGEGGFLIEGADPDDIAAHIAPAGDVNDDGLDDVIVGAPGPYTRFGPPNEPDERNGAAYVVFGKADAETVFLEEFDRGTQGDAGFRIDGEYLGYDVASVGDINDDGHADVAVGGGRAGATYVVYGKSDSLPVDTLALYGAGSPAGGFMIEHPRYVQSYKDVYSVAGAGDVNADGIEDLVIGGYVRYAGRGTAYVVFGTPGGDNVDLMQGNGSWGFRIRGAEPRSETGYDVAGAGDLNGDGLDDVLVGAPAVPSYEGKAYLVYGKADGEPIHLDEPLGRKGFTLGEGESAGRSVAGGGDVDGDGVPDLLVGAPRAGGGTHKAPGRAFLVFGTRTPQDVTFGRLGRLGTKGVEIRGAARPNAACDEDWSNCLGDYAGEVVSFLGDIDGDGRSEVGVAAGGDESLGKRGSTYVLWSGTLAEARQAD